MIFVNANDLDVRMLSNRDLDKPVSKNPVLKTLGRGNHYAIGSGKDHIKSYEKLLAGTRSDRLVVKILL